jgi:plasmid stability protein
MAQLTIRLDDDLADEVRAHADAAGRSLNAWTVAVLRVAVDPEYADSAFERTRGRLARAGLLAPPGAGGRPRPSDEALEEARAAAGRGTPLARIVADDRG